MIVMCEQATDEDLIRARERALRSAGMTEDELRKQAARGRFDTIKARLAWIVVSGIAPETR